MSTAISSLSDLKKETQADFFSFSTEQRKEEVFIIILFLKNQE